MIWTTLREQSQGEQLLPGDRQKLRLERKSMNRADFFNIMLYSRNNRENRQDSLTLTR